MPLCLDTEQRSLGCRQEFPRYTVLICTFILLKMIYRTPFQETDSSSFILLAAPSYNKYFTLQCLHSAGAASLQLTVLPLRGFAQKEQAEQSRAENTVKNFLLIQLIIFLIGNHDVSSNLTKLKH